MESYVVRVYRRDEKNSENLAGLVELIDRKEEKPFVSFAELWMILSSPGKNAERSSEISKGTEGGEKPRR
jgi:hypothetical protein